MGKYISALSEHILNPLIYLLFAIALLYFIAGLVKFIAHGEDEEVHATARRHILYGILGMFIMISAFSLVRLITGSFNIDTSNNLDKIEK